MRSETFPGGGPDAGRRSQRLGFTRHSPAAAVGDADVALASQAAEAGDAMNDPIIEPALGQQPLDGAACAFGDAALQRGQAVELLPILDGVAQNARNHMAQPVVLFRHNEGNAAAFEALFVAAEDGIAGVLGRDLEARFADGNVRAGGQAHQIDGVGQLVDFVEIVDAPDQAAFDVAPGAEIFHVQIAHGEHVRGAASSAQTLGQSCIQR